MPKILILIAGALVLAFAWTQLKRTGGFGGLAAASDVPDESPRASANPDWSLLSGNSQRNRVGAAIAEASSLHQVNPDLLYAIIMTESHFNPKALSHKGAQGLMQLMPGTAREVGVGDANDLRDNILGGAEYLAQMLVEFNGNERLAVAAYNAGPGAIRKRQGIPGEVQPYVEKVMSYYRFFSGDRSKGR